MRRIKLIMAALLLGLMLASCSVSPMYQTGNRYGSGPRVSPRRTSKNFKATASYYGKQFDGRKTANGEVFDMNKLTCAHKEYPFGTRFKVTNPDNGNTVIVRVNDRGPFVSGRDFDLSYGAARQLGMLNDGVKALQFELLEN